MAEDLIMLYIKKKQATMGLNKSTGKAIYFFQQATRRIETVQEVIYAKITITMNILRQICV